MRRIFAIWLALLLVAAQAGATVTTQLGRVTYQCDGTTVQYSFPSIIINNTDLMAVKTDSAGADTTLVVNTDYTVAGAGGAGGATLTLTAGSKCASGYNLTILRNIPLTQQTDYVDGEAFSAESIESALDQNYLIQQQEKEKVTRSIKLGKSASATDATTEINAYQFTNRANTYIGYNASGNIALLPQAAPTVTSGSWVDVASYASLNAAVTAVGGADTTLLVDSITTVTSNLTVPSNVRLWVTQKGRINQSTYTLAINSAFDAPISTVFTGTGAVTFGTGTVAGVYPEWKGSDTAAINFMITAAPYGVPVQFTAATYNIDGIILPKSGTRMVSDGSWLTGTVGNSNLYIIDLNAVSDIKITGLQMKRQDKTVAGSKYCIHLTNGSSRIEIFGNYFTDSYGGIVSQLETSTNSHVNIHDNHFQEMGNGGVFINNRGTAGVRITNNIFSHCGYTQASFIIGAGIEIRGNTGTIVSGNQFYDGTDSVYPNDGVRVEDVSEATAYPGSHNIVSNNVMDNIKGNGVNIIESSGTLVTGNQIRNITASAGGTGGPSTPDAGYSGNGILIATSGTSGKADKTQITSNHIETVVEGVMVVNGTNAYAQIVGNTILTASNNGIYGNFQYSQIRDNKIRGAANIACIRLGTTGGNNVVENNDLSNGSAGYGGISIASNNNLVRNNYIWDARSPVIHNFGIFVAASTGNQLYDNIVPNFNTNRVFLEATTAFAGTTLFQKVTVPASKGASCNKGDWAADTTYLYYAAPTDQTTYNWKRVTLSDAAW